MPTVVISHNTGADFSGLEDTDVQKPTPTTNFGSETFLKCEKYDATYWATCLLRATGLSNIPSNATVSAATLRLRTVFAGGVDNTHTLRRCKRAWVENQATWNAYSTSNNWQTAGGVGNDDRDNTASIASLVINSTLEYKEFSSAALTALVQGWVNGSIANDGLHVERTDGENDSSYRSYVSKEGADGQRPELVVTYSVDTTAPILSGQTVDAGSIGHQGGQPQVTTNEGNGTAYVVVVPNGDTPSVAQIKAGQNSSGGAALYAENKAVAATGVIGFGLVVELSPSTAYDVWFVHTDAASNNSTAVKYDLTTLARTVSKNGTFEFAIRNATAYANKLTGVTLNVTYTPPVAAAIVFWGFFDGDGIGGGAYNSGNVWKFRCLGFEPGTWNYSWEFSDLSASGSGSFTVTDDAGNLPSKLSAYATNPRWFARDGVPHWLKSFYFSWDIWGIVGQPLAWVSANVYQKIIDAGYNNFVMPLLRVETYGGATGRNVTDGPAGTDGQLWQDSNISQTWNFGWNKKLEDHFRWFNERGASVSMFQGFDGYSGSGSDWALLTTGDKDFYVRYIVSRLAPYAGLGSLNHAWEVDSHTRMTEGFELMDRLVSYDKFNHLRGIFEDGSSTNSFNDSRQTLTMFERLNDGAYAFIDSEPPRHNAAALASYYSKPLFQFEPNGIWWYWLTVTYGYTATDADNIIHRNAWATVIGGASFSFEDHGTGTGCTAAQVYGRTTPIARLGYLHSIMSTEVEWWKMSPNNGLLSSFTGNCYCLAEVGAQYLVYRDSNAAFDLTIANGMAWVGEWVDTRTNTRSSAGSGTGGGTPVTFTPPASPTTEWVLKVTPTLSQSLAPSAIASAEAVGAHTVSAAAGAQTLLPASIASLEAVGAHTLTPGAVAIAPGGIVSAETFGALGVAPGAVAVLASAIASLEAVGAVLVQPGAVLVQPGGIASLEAVGAAIVVPGTAVLLVSGITSAQAVGLATVLGGAVVDAAGAAGTGLPVFLLFTSSRTYH